MARQLRSHRKWDTVRVDVPLHDSIAIHAQIGAQQPIPNPCDDQWWAQYHRSTGLLLASDLVEGKLQWKDIDDKCKSSQLMVHVFLKSELVAKVFDEDDITDNHFLVILEIAKNTGTTIKMSNIVKFLTTLRIHKAVERHLIYEPVDIPNQYMTKYVREYFARRGFLFLLYVDDWTDDIIEDALKCWPELLFKLGKEFITKERINIALTQDPSLISRFKWMDEQPTKKLKL